MPFKSEKQRRWMWKNNPEMARRWEAEERMSKAFRLRPVNSASVKANGTSPVAPGKPKTALKPMKPAVAKADMYDLTGEILGDINGIPRTRRIPVSPLDVFAASRVGASGYGKITSRNPFGRRRRRARGAYELLLGSSMMSGNGVGRRW